MKKHYLIYQVLTALLVIALTVPIGVHQRQAGSSIWLTLNVFFALFVMGWPALIIHELGHALAARAAGLKAVAMTIGIGRPLLNFRVDGTRFAICIRRGMGRTLVATPPALPHAVARVLLMIAAGPLANLGCFLTVGWLFSLPGWGFASPRWMSGLVVIEAFQWVSLYMAIISLIPIRLSSPIGITYSDGYHILSGLRKPQRMLQRLAEVYHVSTSYESFRTGNTEEAERQCEQGLAEYPDSFLLKQYRAVISIQMGHFADARERLLKLVGSDGEREFFAASIIKNNIAYADAMLGDPALFDEADRCSREALDDAPKMIAFQGTRGAVLLQLGQLEAGRRLLLRAYKQHSEPMARSSSAAWIAISYARDRDLAEGRRWLEIARRECSTGPEITLAARELGECNSRDSLTTGTRILRADSPRPA